MRKPEKLNMFMSLPSQYSKHVFKLIDTQRLTYIWFCAETPVLLLWKFVSKHPCKVYT